MSLQKTKSVLTAIYSCLRATDDYEPENGFALFFLKIPLNHIHIH